MKLKQRHIWLCILCIYFGAVLTVCLIRPESLPEVQPDLWGIPIDKVAHFLMFFPYPIIAYRTFRPTFSSRWIHLLVLAAIFAAGTGIAMGTERLQGMSEYRSFEMEDFYADILGMECSAVITALCIIFRKQL